MDTGLTWLLPTAAGFLAATLCIAMAGLRLAEVADRLADRTRLGEAFVGTLLLAGATSLPDFAASLTAAIGQRPTLAMSNAMGSMAVNLMFLGIADVTYRHANLEHAAASAENLSLASLQTILLLLLVLAMAAPAVSVYGVHPVTPLVAAAYLYGVRWVRRANARPMWSPRRTAQTVEDVPAADEAGGRGTRALWMQFAALSAVLGAAGWALMASVTVAVDRTGLDEDIGGGLVTAWSTSLPELVTTLAAVRRGALTLAMGNIVGTNCFNVTIVAASDVAFRGGSIFHSVGPSQVSWGLVAALMSAVLVMGLVARQTYGIGRVGFETVAMAGLYALGVALLLLEG